MSEQKQPETKQPVFSILHATAHRLPFEWVKVWREWSARAVNPQDHEYIVAVHESDMERVREGAESIPESETGIPIVIIAQGNRYCSVDNWNIAAVVSKGKVLMLGADDYYPPQNWDAELLSCFEDADVIPPFVVQIDTGSYRDESLISHPIMSRSLYTRWGYFYYPGYESMYADDDLTAHAKADSAVTIINARHIVFDHRHPLLGKSQMDEGYAAQTSEKVHAQGHQLFEKRKANGFRDVELRTDIFGEESTASIPIVQPPSPATRKTIAICIPGEWFCATWVRYMLELCYTLNQEYNVVPLLVQSTNVYAVRQAISDAVLNYPHHIDYALWIDDDNLLKPEQAKLLLHDLAILPEADMVVGWCYIVHDVFNTDLARVSCGWWHESGACIDIPRAQMESDMGHDLIEIDWTGFPVVLMRRELLVKAGHVPFAPLPSIHTPYGFTGEDTAFCRVARDRGKARFFVDRRVKVPHLKLRSAEPNDLLVSKESTSVKVSA